MAGINSVGTQINRLMDAIGFNDSIGDAVGALVDLQRGDRAGFIKNMNDLYEDVNKFLEKKMLGKNFLKNIAKRGTVPLLKSAGFKKAIGLLAPLVKKFAMFRGVAFFNPGVLASTVLLSKLLEMAKSQKAKGTETQGKPIQQQVVSTPQQPHGTVTLSISSNSTRSEVKMHETPSSVQSRNIEERIMLALTGALKENRDEMENLLKDIEKLGSKKSMSDKDKNDLQVLQIKLQVAISRRNEMVSTLSNIMKTFNEMNMATIRNIRI